MKFLESKFSLNFAPIVILLFVLLALIGPKFSKYGEIFPFFSWRLYSKTPNYVEQAEIKLNQIGSDIYKVPERLFQHKEILKITPVNVSVMISRWCNSLIYGQDTMCFEYQNQILKTALGGVNTEYELWLEKFKPLEKYKSEKCINNIYLGTYNDLELLWAKSVNFHLDSFSVNYKKDDKLVGNINFIKSHLNYCVVIGWAEVEGQLPKEILLEFDGVFVSKTTCNITREDISKLKNNKQLIEAGFIGFIPQNIPSEEYFKINVYAVNDSDELFLINK
ncbi:MAG: hypothetical protein P8N54_06190 [Flavobacteriales bacterium]|nr:hypothetical protein [Flavobacteriales bacterium]